MMDEPRESVKLFYLFGGISGPGRAAHFEVSSARLSTGGRSDNHFRLLTARASCEVGELAHRDQGPLPKV